MCRAFSEASLLGSRRCTSTEYIRVAAPSSDVVSIRTAFRPTASPSIPKLSSTSSAPPSADVPLTAMVVPASKGPTDSANSVTAKSTLVS